MDSVGGDGAQDDVGGPQLVDVAEGFLLGPFADGEHGDDRAHADDDAQAGQGAAQLVEVQVGHREAEGFEEEREVHRSESTEFARWT